MAALIDGDDTALNRIMERWSGPLHGFVYRYVQNRDEASDVVQETFVRVFLNRGRYRRGGRFSTWLYTIAVNLCRNRARWRRRHPTVSLDAEGAGGMSVYGEVRDGRGVAPDRAMEQTETIRAVREAISRLPHELRTALILFQYQELSQEEIGRVMGCSAKAVETRIYRARKKLRQWLTPGRV